MELTPELVRQYLDANPEIRDSTAEFLRSQGGQAGGRSVYQWVYDDMKANPGSVHIAQLEDYLNGSSDGSTPGAGVDMPLEQALLDQVLKDYLEPDMAADAARRKDAQASLDRFNAALDEAARVNSTLTSRFDTAKYIELYPDIKAGFDRLAKDAQGRAILPDGRAVTLDQWSEEHYNTHGKNEGRVGPMTRSRLEDEYAQADATGTRLADAARAEADALRTADGEMLRTRTGAYDAEAAAMRTAAEKLNTDRLAALAPVEAERISVADTMVSGINTALEGERDRQVAERALQGFVGSSTMDDAAMLRATLGARQNAAETMGGAKLANATDRRSIGDERASNMFGIEGNRTAGVRTVTDESARNLFGIESGRAAGVRDAADAVTSMRQGYFDNDFNRRLSAALLPASLETQRMQFTDAAEQVGRSGLNRTLDTLNWWSSTPTPPNYTPATTTASNVGNSIANLGANIFGSAVNIGNANNWWQKPKTDPKAPFNGSKYFTNADAAAMGGG